MKKQVLEEIKNKIIAIQKSKSGQIFIGIDGLGGAGKTTFAKELAKKLGGANIVCVDEFYKPINERKSIMIDNISQDFNWEKLENVVFKDSKKESIVIIEGIYSTQERFKKYYDFTIWLDTSKEERIKNMIAREGEVVAQEWQEKWMPMEDKYYDSKPQLNTNLILN